MYGTHGRSPCPGVNTQKTLSERNTRRSPCPGVNTQKTLSERNTRRSPCPGVNPRPAGVWLVTRPAGGGGGGKGPP